MGEPSGNRDMSRNAPNNKNGLFQTVRRRRKLDRDLIIQVMTSAQTLLNSWLSGSYQ